MRGLPTIATRHTGIPELVAMVKRISSRRKDPEAIARGSSSHAHPEKWHKMVNKDGEYIGI